MYKRSKSLSRKFFKNPKKEALFSLQRAFKNSDTLFESVGQVDVGDNLSHERLSVDDLDG